jgi:hypothetical protein
MDRAGRTAGAAWMEGKKETARAMMKPAQTAAEL